MRKVIKEALNSLENEPERWFYDPIMKGYKSYRYKIYRDDGLSVWVGNKAYGIHIEKPGFPTIGSVYFWWVPFGGAPWQHRMFNA